ncbi:LacI family DNA-binding transcriptional regulator [Arthrobacter sp. NPDC057013]
MGTSMRDVAELAGVSQRTVSNVVSGYIHVKPETRARVQAAIDSLKYKPNISARRLRQGRTGILALALPEIAAPYFAELADHVEQRAAELGVTVLIGQTGGIRDRELLVLRGYQSNLIDGLILNPLSITAQDLVDEDIDFPVVLLGESLEATGTPVVHISVDNEAAAAEATQHLIDMGRRSIAAIGASRNMAVSGPASHRLRGYLAAMDRANLPVTTEIDSESTAWTRAAGYAAAQRLLDRKPDIDAIFCFNDTLALGALKCFLDRGVKVPQDIALVGWDDIEECSYSSPALTSISPDKAGIAKTAVDTLLARVSGQTINPADPTEIRADYKLMARASTTG